MTAMCIPGGFPLGAAAEKGEAGITSIVQQASAISTTATITAPADIQAGDLLVLFDSASGFSTPSTVLASGFTSIVNSTSSATRAILSYKLANGSEGSSILTGMSSSFMFKILVVFRANVPATSLTPLSPHGEVTTGDPTAQVVTASGGTLPLVVIGAYASVLGGSVATRSMSPAKDGEIANATSAYVAWKVYISSPADVTVDTGDNGTNALQSCYIEMAA